MTEPAAVMERCPTPRVIRFPIPAAISIDPATAIEIRLPASVSDNRGRLPAAAIALHIDPGSVGSKGIVKAGVSPCRRFRWRQHGGFTRIFCWIVGFGERRRRRFTGHRRISTLSDL